LLAFVLPARIERTVPNNRIDIMTDYLTLVAATALRETRRAELSLAVRDERRDTERDERS